MKFTYKNISGISEKQILETGNDLIAYINHIQHVVKNEDYGADEASAILPSDPIHERAVYEVAKHYDRTKLKLIIVIGIGGSNLGTKAIYEAVAGFSKQKPTVIFLDTVNPSYMFSLKEYLDKAKLQPDEYLINVVTKSGTTTETIMNLEFILSVLDKGLRRLVVTTDKESKLDKKTNKLGVTTLFINKKVGGRYSVFSTVGLFPLFMMGFDTNALLEGSLIGRKNGLQTNILENPSAISAIILYLQNKNGKVINDNFMFNTELESLGKWYRQLMGESIGKNGKGITPTVSIGSTDLHSVAQLYLGGPNDKVTTFVHASPVNEPRLRSNLVFNGLVDVVAGKKPSQIMEAILKGTQEAYNKKNVPFMAIELDDMSEKSIGEYMQFKMLEMMYLGKLLGINTFDQPNVEDYKKETRKLLS